MNKENYRKYWTIFGIASLFVLFLMNFSNILSGISLFFEVLAPFTAGIIIAYIVNLPYRFLYNSVFDFLGTDNGFKGKIRKPVSLLLSFLFFGAIIAFILGIMIPEISKSVNMIITNTQEILHRLDEISHNQYELVEGLRQANSRINSLCKSISAHIKSTAESLKNIETCQSIIAYNAQRTREELEFITWMNIFY